jgi:long-chain acyl-CoA synthetase
MLEKSAARYKENTALIFFDRSTSYDELLRKVLCMSAAFEKMGVKKGDRVAIMLPNSPELVIAFFAVFACGGVVVMCNPLYTVRELRVRVEESGAKVLVTLDLFWPKSRELKEEGLLKDVVLTTLGRHIYGFKKIIYPLLRRFKGKVNFPHGKDAYFFDPLLEDFSSASPTLSGRDTERNDLAAIQYTAGTTGIPQGAMLTHANLLSNSKQVAGWFPELEPGKEVMLAVLPFFHIFGLTVCLNMSVMTGGAIVLVPKFSGKEVIKLLNVIRKHKPTLFPAVPTIYAAINNFVAIDDFDLSSIKFCISGAAPLPGPIQKKFQRLTGAVLVEGYGLSEASPVTHCNPLDKKRNKIGSIGLPLSETEAKIIDRETGKEVPVGQVGELIVRGPQVMQGYWKHEDDSARVLKEGWLYTGDLARTDEEGYFYIVDRLKDLIIVSGFNVYPREVEEILYNHPKVADAAVLGVPDEYSSEKVKAYVVLQPGAYAAVDEIRDYCREHLTPYKVPKIVEFKDELPKSLIGKVLKKDLKEEV